MREPGAPVPREKQAGRTHGCRNFRPSAQHRRSWMRNSAPHLKSPAPLDPARGTIKQTRAAHRQSAARCLEMLKEAPSNGTSKRVTRFSRESWAPSWPAGTTMFRFMFAHEAHHRGQAIVLARQRGYKLPDKATYGI